MHEAGQALMRMCMICMAASLCEQILDGRCFYPAVRMVLGMELAAMVLGCVLELCGRI